MELELFRDLTVTPASEFSVPDVHVVGTQRHTGTLAIHRSSHIELLVKDSRGVQRADRDGGVVLSDSPLPWIPFQTFSFQGKFTLTLASALVPQSVRAELQSVLRVGETERSLETRFHVNVRGRALHELRFNIPRDWRLEEVAGPEALHWSQVPTADVSTITLFLSRGILGDVDIILRGPLPERIANAPVMIPHLKVEDVAEQPHILVVQADPGFDVQAEQLAGCRTILLDQVGDWLQSDQREASRLAIEMTRPEYQGELFVQERQPRIRWQTITNVQATDQNVQETILLDYHVDRAGVRELRFLLPEALRDATIRAPMLQRIIKEPASTSEVPGWFRMRLIFQDRILGELRVLVELDRLMSPNGHSLPIPRPEGVDPGIQFVAVESSGWTEVSVRDVVGLEPLTRQHRDWKTLESSLGDQIVQAFRVTGDPSQTQITIERQVRDTVTTTAARIAFAEAKLAMDPQGNYRGIQT
ncbi:MAG: hypothetical protein O2931_09755 [Planctomycetota bacterium]|nr:hypothetical protein [Planctomycetota bacterium]MDA1179065.1 hypothetical protein [Planctomycetota bacterium]